MRSGRSQGLSLLISTTTRSFHSSLLADSFRGSCTVTHLSQASTNLARPLPNPLELGSCCSLGWPTRPRRALAYSSSTRREVSSITKTMLVSSSYLSAALPELTGTRYRGIGSTVVQRLPHPRQYLPQHPRHRLSHQPRTRLLRRRSHRGRDVQDDLLADPDRCVSTCSSPAAGSLHWIRARRTLPQFTC